MLAEAFPRIQVELDPIFIKDGAIWTSAGITAGIDMALAIVSEDLGRMAAMDVAKSMVVQMARSGGQSQFSTTLGRQTQDRTGRFEALHLWIMDNLCLPMTVQDLSVQVGMSPRNFARIYSRDMGTTPAKAVRKMRVDGAGDLLETSSISIKQIALATGFVDEDRMRRAFLAVLNVSPSDYRKTFRVSHNGT